MGIRVRATWAPSRNFGWVRTVEVINESVRLSSSVLTCPFDVMPPGVDPGVEQGVEPERAQAGTDRRSFSTSRACTTLSR